MIDDVLDVVDVETSAPESLPEASEDPAPSAPESLPEASEYPAPSVPESPPEISEDPALPVEDVPVVAVPDEIPSEALPEPDTSTDSILDSFLAGVFAGVSSDPPAGDVEEPPQEAFDLVGIETFALSPITSSSGLKGKLLDLIGPYDNIVTQFKYQSNVSSNYSYVNEVTPDYPWIFSAVLFIVLMVSLFRFLGRCFSWMK